ncbi:hypothetical protein MLD38_028163 [Melastoma candidum]|uniref:Uncharacterized protein n=2 Tax=Melastoma candidum TaxID=119954 RepID=A0ACB9N117_9MYRT|nr:hypothetical protein MLD38_028163 [Melastoma candidum]
MAKDLFSFSAPSPFSLSALQTPTSNEEYFDGEEAVVESGIPDVHSEIAMKEQRTDSAVGNWSQHSFSIQSIQEKMSVRKPIEPRPIAVTSFELLGHYWDVHRRQKQEKEPRKIEEETQVDRRRLSTVEKIRAAGEGFIQLQEQKDDDFSVVMHSYGQSFLGLSEEDMKDLELTLILLSAAEKIGERQFDCASIFLSHCKMLSSERGGPLQRIILCFAEVLCEWIDKATGKYEPKGQKEPNTDRCLATISSWLPCHNQLPLIQIAQFASVQALVDSTATARRIHVIDLALRTGVHVIVLMQALLERKTKAVEVLKVTAVTTVDKEEVEESGRRLASAAKTMGLNFSFEVIFLDNIEDVDDDLFQIEDGEAVVIYASMVLKKMISQQKSLEKLMNILRNLHPSVMVVTEIEANHNSPSFVSRFIEALFFYSASFDCLETCMAEDAENIRVTEQYLRCQVKNILSAEGDERTMRDVKIVVWRAFFRRYKMVEIGFSKSSLYQARLVAQRFPCSSFCTIEPNKKCLILGWKGTPLLSLSAWKFR